MICILCSHWRHWFSFSTGIESGSHPHQVEQQIWFHLHMCDTALYLWMSIWLYISICVVFLLSPVNSNLLSG